jgi:hypothetical protein
MVRKIVHRMMLALAAGALLSAGSVSAHPAVPFKDHGQFTIVANLQDVFVDKSTGDLIVPGVVQQTGEATHLGRYSLTIHDEHDLTTDATWGAGQYTAANGDTLNFTLDEPPNGPAVLTFNGGTGRFAGATGSATASSGNVTMVLQGSLLTISGDITVVGTISY